MTPFLVAEIECAYGVELTNIQPHGDGMDAYAQTWAADSADGRFFLKVRSKSEPGIELACALFEIGIAEVLAPIRTLIGQVSLQTGDQHVLLYPFIDGQNGFEKDLELAHWERIGQVLRQIHGFQPTNQLPVEDFSAPVIHRMTDIQTHHPQIADSMSHFSKELAEIVEITPALGQECQVQDWRFVPCHADLHVGNVLVTDSDIRIIDWDSPHMSPAECDLLFFCDGGILDRHGKAEEDAFFRGYGPFQPNRKLLSFYRMARILDDLIEFAVEASDPQKPEQTRDEAAEWFRKILFAYRDKPYA